MSDRPVSVRIVEVGPRDGLQNEAAVIPTGEKVRFIRALAAAGLREIEIGAFVRADRVPRMADTADVVAQLLAGPLPEGVRLSALVPNLRGLEAAVASGIERVAIFAAASESFNRANLGRGIEECMESYEQVAAAALAARLSVRAYVSTAWRCPYEGPIAPVPALAVARRFLEMGADEVSMGDTLGLAVPDEVSAALECWLETLPLERLALHFHDTAGTALANVVTALERGVANFDASAGGLGGCPFAPGAAGNLATEDLVYLLDRSGIRTGVDLDGVVCASRLVEPLLGHSLPGRQYRRLASAIANPVDSSA